MQSVSRNKLTGYHYTNIRRYQGIKDGSTYGKTGLIPIKRFVALSRGNGLPREAHDGVIEGLLEPEPQSWLTNTEFPFNWSYLMHDICRERETILLSFEIRSGDNAYVVERAHVERELYREAKGRGKPTKESMDEAFRRYWGSRVPVFDYHGGYSLPQLTIWSPIEFGRLNIEWQKPSDEIWERIQANGW